MALTDGLIAQVYPLAGDAAIKNIVDGSTFTGTGTPTLIDQGAEKAWSLATGTFLTANVTPKTFDVDANGSGVTIAMRFIRVTTGSAPYMQFSGITTSAGTSDSGVRFTGFDANNYRGRVGTGFGSAATTTGNVNGTIITVVYRAATLAASSGAPNTDSGAIWQNRVGRVGTDPEATVYNNMADLTLEKLFLNCQTSGQWTLLDFAYWDRELTNAEAASVADDYRGVMPAPSSGTTPIAFTGTIPAQSATVGTPFSLDVASYFTGTQTPFSYALATGDLTGTGLSRSGSVISGTPTSAGDIAGLSMSGTDADLNVATSNTFTITVSAGGDVTAPTFTVAPAVSSVTQTGGTATATINETGSIFYVIVPNAESTPSVAQVIVGQNASGGAPLDSGSAVSTTTLSDAFTGLTASTAYKACFVARDDESTPNVQAAVTVVNFTTASVSTATYTTGILRKLVGGAVLANTALTYFRLYNPTTGALVLNRTDLSTDANGRVTCTDAAITAGVDYKADWLAVTGETRMSKKAAT